MLKEIHPDIAVIIVTGYPSLDTAIRAVNEGASAYITKPLNMNNVLVAVREAIEKQRLTIESRERINRGQQVSTEGEVKKIRIVVGIRDYLLRNGICSTIRDAGMTLVGETDNDDTLIELISQHRPDIVVISFTIPDTNRETLIRRIKKMLPTVGILVICPEEEVESSFKSLIVAGAGGCIQENATKEQLIQAIHSVYFGQVAASLKVVQQVLADTSRPGQSDVVPSPLNSRELEILQLAIEGMSNNDIAKQLSISKRTVDTHFSSIFGKLSVRSRTKALYKALKNNWITIS